MLRLAFLTKRSLKDLRCNHKPNIFHLHELIFEISVFKLVRLLKQIHAGISKEIVGQRDLLYVFVLIQTKLLFDSTELILMVQTYLTC